MDRSADIMKSNMPCLKDAQPNVRHAMSSSRIALAIDFTTTSSCIEYILGINTMINAQKVFVKFFYEQDHDIDEKVLSK